jgi:hypothetical protein
MGIFEGDAAGDRIKYNADVPMAAAKGIRAAVAIVGRSNISCCYSSSNSISSLHSQELATAQLTWWHSGTDHHCSTTITEISDRIFLLLSISSADTAAAIVDAAATGGPQSAVLGAAGSSSQD